MLKKLRDIFKMGIHSVTARVVGILILIVLSSFAILYVIAQKSTNENLKQLYSSIGRVTADLIAISVEEHGADTYAYANDDILAELQQFCGRHAINDIYIWSSEPPYEMAREIVYVDQHSTQVTSPEESEVFQLTEDAKRVFSGEIESDFQLYKYDSIIYMSYMNGVYDGSGKCISLVGVDFLLKDVVQQENRLLQKNLGWLILVLTVTVIILVFSMDQMIIKHIRTIGKKMRGLIANENIDEEKLVVKGKSELSQMAADYNQMADDVRHYIKTMEGINSAAQIQNGILPPAFSETDVYYVDALIKPAKYVGGDFYDYFEIDENLSCFVMADVSGKGLQAAIFMANAMSAIRYSAKVSADPAKALFNANNDICKRNPEQLFVTVFIAVYDRKTQELAYANGGHNPPFLIRCGKVIKLQQAENTLVGLFENEQFEAARFRTEPGDRLFLYTDGVVEAVNLQKEFFGEERLKKLLHEAPSPLTEFIMDQISGFEGGAEQFDDITMLELVYKKEWKINVRACEDSIVHLKQLIMENSRIPDSQKKKIYLASEEIFINICRYAYKGVETGNVEVSVEIGPDIASSGESFSPEDEKVSKEAGAVSAYEGGSKADEDELLNTGRMVLSVTFRDSGIQYDPLKNFNPDMDYDIDTQIGGLGKLLAFTIMDQFGYQYQDGQNILVLKKNLDG